MFHFPLEKLLHHRKFLEDTLSRELAVFKRSVAEEKRKLDAIRMEQESLVESFRKGQPGEPTVLDLTLFQCAFQRSVDRQRRQETRLKEAEKLAGQKRTHLVEAMKRRKILDRLKERRMDEYRLGRNRKEQDFMNEMAVSRFNRKGPSQ